MRQFAQALRGLFFRPAVIAAAATMGAGIIGLAVNDGLPELRKVESVVLASYQDPVGIWTKCTGDTFDVQPNRVYTWEECDESDKGRFREFVEKVYSSSGIENKDLLIAHSIFAYNVGINGYNASQTLRLTKRGHYEAGCMAMMNWHKAGGKNACNRSNGVYGLINHREHTINLCLEAIGSEPLKQPFMCRSLGWN